MCFSAVYGAANSVLQWQKIWCTQTAMWCCFCGRVWFFGLLDRKRNAYTWSLRECEVGCVAVLCWLLLVPHDRKWGLIIVTSKARLGYLSFLFGSLAVLEENAKWSFQHELDFLYAWCVWWMLIVFQNDKKKMKSPAVRSCFVVFFLVLTAFSNLPIARWILRERVVCNVGCCCY